MAERMEWSIGGVPQGDSGEESSGSSEGRPVTSRRSGEQTAQDRNYALRLAHAMAHNPHDALLPSPPGSPPRALPGASARIVTVNDIKNRSCWICSDGDAEEEAGQVKPRAWIHPCKCSLVAHEDCLLTWIRSRRVADPKKPILCPQCSHPYGILERKPSLLRLFESGNKLVHDVVPWASAGVGGASIVIAATAYGCGAIRLWLGKRAAARILGGPWPWHYYIDIPCIPFALILSRFRVLDHALAWLPTIAAFPILHVPFLAITSRSGAQRPWDQRGFYQTTLLASRQSWPPGPVMTLFLVPWIRAMYISLKKRITRRVLSPFVRRRTGAATTATTQAGRNRTRVIVIGEDAPMETLDENGIVNTDEMGNPRELPPGTDAVENDRTVYVSTQSLGRVCLGALSSPVIANLMGKLLARIARSSDWLRRFLGIDTAFRPSVGTTRALRGKAAAGATAAATGTKHNSLASLFSGGAFDYNAEDAYASERPAISQPAALVDQDGSIAVFGHVPSMFDDLDPVWFRNAIGAGLFVVAKDVVQLCFRYLRLEHARQGGKRTKIIDRPFFGGIIDELELRDTATTTGDITTS